MSFNNPTPVAVCLVPVRDHDGVALLGIIRNNEPGKGKIALPGGYLNEYENFEQAASRELLEETGVLTRAEDWKLIASHPNQTNRVLVFCQLNFEVSMSDYLALTVIQPEEVQGFFLIKPEILPSEDIAFPLHALEMARFFYQK